MCEWPPVAGRSGALGPGADARLRMADPLQPLWREYAETFPKEAVGAAWGA